MIVKKTVFGDGTQTRNFTYIDDVVDANILAAENNIIGEVFNIGGGSRITVNALIDEIKKFVGNKARLEYIEIQKGDVQDTWADVSKAKNELGWKPMINIYKGLERHMEWYKRLGV